jgi:hypothetical protein
MKLSLQVIAINAERLFQIAKGILVIRIWHITKKNQRKSTSVHTVEKGRKYNIKTAFKFKRSLYKFTCIAQQFFLFKDLARATI